MIVQAGGWMGWNTSVDLAFNNAISKGFSLYFHSTVTQSSVFSHLVSNCSRGDVDFFFYHSMSNKMSFLNF